jgi:uncharacterized delta-60 repeat protein
MKKIILFLFTFNCFSQAGTFDTTFDTDGIQTFCQATVFDFTASDAGIQSTGKIVQFCYSNNKTVFNFIRYNIDGSIDTTFGNNGRLSLTNNSLFQNQGYIRNFAIQSDDKILVAGEGGSNQYVARLLPNGTLDTSFNGQGYLTFNFGTNNSILYNVSTQSDGKILVCGNSGPANSTVRPFFAVARITTNGVLDTTFGSSGIVLTAFNISTSSSIARCMAVQPDGKIVLGGVTPNATTQTNNFALVRLNPIGTVDTTFGTDGKVTTSVISAADYGISKLLVQPDGKIVAGAVYANSGIKMAMLRYLSNGLLDSTFGINGIVATNESSGNCSIAMQADGKFILAGGFSTSSFKFFRYTGAGVLDTTFANNANVFPATYGEASTVLIQTDQKIVVCGSTYTSDIINSCAAVIRLNNDVLGTEGFATNEVGVFPNPVQNQLSITNEEAMQYELFSVLGAKIQSGNLAIHGQVDCNGLAKGLYLLKLNKDNGESKVVKVVKEY